MEITATVTNHGGRNSVTLGTDGTVRSLSIPPKTTGAGSSANGGELLALAVATCFCNDLYREAATLGIELRGVEVEARATFGGPGEAASRISYAARLHSDAPESELRRLLEHTDRVAEVHNTLRFGIPVTLQPRLDGP